MLERLQPILEILLVLFYAPVLVNFNNFVTSEETDIAPTTYHNLRRQVSNLEDIKIILCSLISGTCS